MEQACQALHKMFVPQPSSKQLVENKLVQVEEKLETIAKYEVDQVMKRVGDGRDLQKFSKVVQSSRFHFGFGSRVRLLWLCKEVLFQTFLAKSNVKSIEEGQINAGEISVFASQIEREFEVEKSASGLVVRILAEIRQCGHAFVLPKQGAFESLDLIGENEVVKNFLSSRPY